MVATYVKRAVGVGGYVFACGNFFTFIVFCFAVSAVQTVIMSMWSSMRVVNEAFLAKPAVPLHVGFSLYNVTNLEAIKTGTTPQVSVAGPYVYDLYEYWSDIKFSDDATEVNMNFFQRFVFNDELSKGTLTDMITSANPSFLAATAGAGFNATAALAGLKADPAFIARMGGTTFATRSAENWLINFDDPIVEASAGNGQYSGFLGCVGDRDVEDSNSFCNNTSPSPGTFTLYTGTDQIGKWLAFKDSHGEAAADLPAVPFPVPVQPGPDGYIFPATEPFSYFDKDFGRVHPMELVQDLVVGGLPMKRFAVQDSVWKTDPTTPAGLLNLSAVGPLMLRWGHSCGFESGKRNEQVASFVTGHITGFPACDYNEDGYYLQTDVYTGLPWRLSVNKEVVWIASDVLDGEYSNKPDGPLTTEFGPFVGPSGRYSLIPHLHIGLVNFGPPEEFLFFIWEMTDGVLVSWGQWVSAAFLCFILNSIFCVCACVLTLVSKAK